MVVKVDERAVIRVRRGAAKVFLLEVQDADGNARNLTGESLLFSCSQELGDGSVVLTKTITGSESGSVFASGIAALIFTATDFNVFTIQEGDWSTFLAWSLTLTTAGGTKYAVDIGGKGAALLELEQVA
jgi:hypothetical protein